jgi:hypothetical protein
MKYKVINYAKKDLYIEWSEGLLPEKEYKEWIKFKGSEEFSKPVSTDGRVIPPYMRLKFFVEDRGLGERYKVEIKSPEYKVVYEYRFFIPIAGGIEVNERQRQELKRYERKGYDEKLEFGQVAPKRSWEGYLEFEEEGRDEESVGSLEGLQYKEIADIAVSLGVKYRGLPKERVIELIKEARKVEKSPIE